MYDSTNTNGLNERSLGRTPTNFAIRSILGNLTRSGLSRPLARCMGPLMSVTSRLSTDECDQPITDVTDLFLVGLSPFFSLLGVNRFYCWTPCVPGPLRELEKTTTNCRSSVITDFASDLP